MKPTVLPFSDDGRSAAFMPATFISLVGSRTRIMWGLYQLRSFPRKRESSSLLYCSPGSRLRVRPAKRVYPFDGSQSAHAPMAAVTALVLCPIHGGMIAPKPP